MEEVTCIGISQSIKVICSSIPFKMTICVIREVSSSVVVVSVVSSWLSSAGLSTRLYVFVAEGSLGNDEGILYLVMVCYSYQFLNINLKFLMIGCTYL